MPKTAITTIDHNLDAPGRPTKGHSKVDLSKAIKLRFAHGLSYTDIAKQFGCTKQAVHTALSKFVGIFDNTGVVQAFRSSAADIYAALESNMVMCLIDDLEAFK